MLAAGGGHVSLTCAGTVTGQTDRRTHICGVIYCSIAYAEHEYIWYLDMNIRLNLCTLLALSINFIFLLFSATPRSRFKVAPSSFILGIFWAFLFLISIATLPFVVIVFSVTSCGQCTCVLRGLPFFLELFAVVVVLILTHFSLSYAFYLHTILNTHTHTHTGSTLSTQARAQSPLLVSLFLPIRTQFYTHTLSLFRSHSLARALFLHFISFHLFHLCVSLLTSFAVHFITVFFFALRCRCLWLWLCLCLCSCLLLCVVASSPSYVCIAPSVTVTVVAATADVAAATAGVAVLYLDFGFNGEWTQDSRTFNRQKAFFRFVALVIVVVAATVFHCFYILCYCFCCRCSGYRGMRNTFAVVVAICRTVLRVCSFFIDIFFLT